MFIYLDESMLGNHFTVGAVIVHSQGVTEGIDKEFRSVVKKNKSIGEKESGKICNDPKESYLYRNQKLLLANLFDLMTLKSNKKGKTARDDIFFYAACVIETHSKVPLFEKYNLTCLEIVKRIAEHFPDETLTIVMDRFDKSDHWRLGFEQVLHEAMPNLQFTLECLPGHQCRSLVIADIVAGTVRRECMAGQESEFYRSIMNQLLDKGYMIIRK